MNEIWGLVPALVTGVLLGAMFFGGLWWTVRKGVSSARPAGLVLQQPAATNEHGPCWILYSLGRPVGEVAGVPLGIYHCPSDRDTTHSRHRKANPPGTGDRPCTLARTKSSSGNTGSSS